MVDSETRTSQYSDAGHIFGATAAELGSVVPPQIVTAWSETMVRLSAADDFSEEDPRSLSPDKLLEILGLDVADKQLNLTAANLLSANLQSIEAQGIKQHFRSREQEALSSADLLRFQSPEDIRGNLRLWDQLGGLAVVGIHLDSLVDAREDASKLTQFTSAQLARGAFTHMIKAARGVRGETLIACSRAMKSLGLYPKMGKRLFEKIVNEHLVA